MVAPSSRNAVGRARFGHARTNLATVEISLHTTTARGIDEGRDSRRCPRHRPVRRHRRSGRRAAPRRIGRRRGEGGAPGRRPDAGVARLPHLEPQQAQRRPRRRRGVRSRAARHTARRRRRAPPPITARRAHRSWASTTRPSPAAFPARSCRRCSSWPANHVAADLPVDELLAGARFGLCDEQQGYRDGPILVARARRELVLGVPRRHRDPRPAARARVAPDTPAPRTPAWCRG